jgi:hypothetical protein
LHISLYCRYFAPAIRSETLPERRKWFLKNFIKLFFKKIWKFEKVALPLQPLSLLNGSNLKLVLTKKMKNFSKKIWKLQKLALPLQPISASIMKRSDKVL